MPLCRFKNFLRVYFGAFYPQNEKMSGLTTRANSPKVSLQGCIQCYTITCPANNGSTYANEQAVTFDGVTITSTGNRTYIVEASTYSTGVLQYSRYFVDGSTVYQLEKYDPNTAANLPVLRFDSSGNLRMRMNGETTQTYSVGVVVKRF